MAYDAWTEGYLKAKQSKANKFDPNISIRFERVGNWIVSAKVLPKDSNVEYYDHLYKSTCIRYLYRDASNYKMPNEVIVPGRYTDEQIKMIIDCLDNGMYFIPNKVGFPEKKFDTETEDDHPWFELNKLDFEDSAEAPQIDKSPEEVVDLFLAAKDHWEE